MRKILLDDNKFNFDIEEAPIYTEYNGQLLKIHKKKAIIRKDTGEFLSDVSVNYKVIEHKYVVDLFYKLIDKLNIDVDIKILAPSRGRYLIGEMISKTNHLYEIKKGDLVKMGIKFYNSYNKKTRIGFDSSRFEIVFFFICPSLLFLIIQAPASTIDFILL